MREAAKVVVSRVITRNGPLWNMLVRAYYLPSEMGRALYRRATKDSIFYREEELSMCAIPFPRKLAKVMELYRPGSVLDLGCGTGQSLDYFVDRGVDVVGVEGSALAISRARHPERMRQWNLNRELDLGRKFDMIWCTEVVEHIHPKYVHNLMKSFSNHSDRVVMSAARPGQTGEGHFNEQPPEYWIRLFEGYGFRHDAPATETFRGIDELFSDNMLVFSR
jgi:SAM-dependent methyltransferase